MGLRYISPYSVVKGSVLGILSSGQGSDPLKLAPGNSPLCMGAGGGRHLHHLLLPPKKHQNCGQRFIPGVLELWLQVIFVHINSVTLSNIDT